MTDQLKALSTRLAELATAYPDGVPAEMLQTEATRVNALVEMIGEGLCEP